MAAQDIPSNHNAVKDADFRITGPGRYRLRNGGEVNVHRFYSSRHFMWRKAGSSLAWLPDGSLLTDGESPYDIVARVDEPEPEFRITGPGRYRMANGNDINLVEGSDKSYPWSECDNPHCKFDVYGKHVHHPNHNIVAGPLDGPDKKTNTFRITGPGRYRDRTNEIATVCRYVGDDGRDMGWEGIDSLGRPSAWRRNGGWLVAGYDYHLDLVEGPLADETESAGLRGFAGVQDGRVIGFRTAAEALENGWDTVVDLSKVPASAIVRAEPMRQKGWMNVWNYPKGKTPLLQGLYNTREMADAAADEWNAAERIACIEIEYTVGEGL